MGKNYKKGQKQQNTDNNKKDIKETSESDFSENSESVDNSEIPENFETAENGDSATKKDTDKIKIAKEFLVKIKSKVSIKKISALFNFSVLNKSIAAITTGLMLVLLISFAETFFQENYGRQIFVFAIVCIILTGLIIMLNLKFSEKKASIFNYVIFFLMPVLSLFMSECMNGVFIYNFSPLTFFASYALFLLVQAGIMIIFANFKISMAISNIAIFIFSLVANLVLVFRGTPFMPADFLSAGTGFDVLSNYNFSFSYQLILGIFIFIAIMALIIKIPKCKKNKCSFWLRRIICLGYVLAVLIPFYTTDVAADNGLKPDFWNQKRGYHNSGTLLNFTLNTKYLIIEKPEGYRADDIATIVNSVLAATPEDHGILASATNMQNIAAEKLAAELAEEERLKAESLENITGAATSASGLQSEPDAGSQMPVENTEIQGEIDGNDIISGGALEEEIPQLPNTGKDTPLAVACTSDIDQPESSAHLKKDQQPNIIVIMNETFSDLRVLGEFETNQDYMPFIRNLTENTIKGNLYMPVNGAGTSNSEFEFLTGNPMAFLTGGSNAYELYVKSKLPSLAYTLKDQGYSAEALHVYYGTSWKRDINYPLLGFDNFNSLETYIDPAVIEKYRNGEMSFMAYEDYFNEMYPGENPLLRRFVSDSFDYKLLELMYAHRDETKPYFVFNVTMQNHGGYDSGYSNFEQEIRLTSVGSDDYYPKTNRFLSLIYRSDQAFKELVDYYSRQKEPTIILMFGDHQPSIEEGFVEEMLGKKLTNLSVEQQQKRFITPFVIWANYNIEEGYVDKISSNYLSTLLLQTAGAQMPTYNAYLSALYSNVPVIDTTGYITSDNTYYEYEDESSYSELLNGYKKVEYNNLFDAVFKQTQLFYLQTEPVE